MYTTGSISINFPNLSYLEEMPSQIQPFEGNEIKVKFWILEILSASRILKCSQTKSLLWICDSRMLGKSSKNILPKGGLMVIYHGRIRKTSPSNKSKLPEKILRHPKKKHRPVGVVFMGSESPSIPYRPSSIFLYPACACSERLVIWHLKMRRKKTTNLANPFTIHGIGI